MGFDLLVRQVHFAIGPRTRNTSEVVVQDLLPEIDCHANVTNCVGSEMPSHWESAELFFINADQTFLSLGKESEGVTFLDRVEVFKL